jgi:hypothetical protein
MASAGLEQPSTALKPTRPVVLYIAVPVALWAFRWVTAPILAHARSTDIASGIASLIGSTLVAFLLAFYAARIWRTGDWRSFSQWFGAWVLLYPLLWPMSNTVVVLEIFEIGKRRVRGRQ